MNGLIACIERLALVTILLASPSCFEPRPKETCDYYQDRIEELKKKQGLSQLALIDRSGRPDPFFPCTLFYVVPSSEATADDVFISLTITVLRGDQTEEEWEKFAGIPYDLSDDTYVNRNIQRVTPDQLIVETERVNPNGELVMHNKGISFRQGSVFIRVGLSQLGGPLSSKKRTPIQDLATIPPSLLTLVQSLLEDN